jgi:hypothetical protein
MTIWTFGAIVLATLALSVGVLAILACIGKGRHDRAEVMRRGFNESFVDRNEGRLTDG